MHIKKGDKDLRETDSIRNGLCLVGPFGLSRQQSQAKAGSMLVAGRFVRYKRLAATALSFSATPCPQRLLVLFTLCSNC
jgi:hypothetical protein